MTNFLEKSFNTKHAFHKLSILTHVSAAFPFDFKAGYEFSLYQFLITALTYGFIRDGLL